MRVLGKIFAPVYGQKGLPVHLLGSQSFDKTGAAALCHLLSK
jgi:hypothetical protein